MGRSICSGGTWLKLPSTAPGRHNCDGRIRKPFGGKHRADLQLKILAHHQLKLR